MLIGASVGKAIAAIDRTVITRRKRYARDTAALCAYTFMHLPLAVTFASSRRTAFLTAARFMHEAFFPIEFLLASRKDERLVALHADYRPILG